MRLLLLLFFVITFATAIVQYFSVRYPNRVPELRKVLHLVAIIACAIGTALFPNPQFLAILFLVFSVVLFVVIHYKILNISTGKSWGIALFPLAFGLLLWSGQIAVAHIVTAMVILAISDALAGFVGSRYATWYWTPLFEPKSVLGSAVFLVSALVILLCRYDISVESLGAFFLIALLGAGVEMFSWRGSDNFWIPLMIAVCLEGVGRSLFWTMDGFILLGLAIFVAPIMYRRKWLNREGAVAASFMGIWMASLLGIKALAFPVLFLGLGSLVSKLNKKTKEKDGRSSVQVFANGGIGMLFALLAPLAEPDKIWFCFVVVFASANADTLSSEVGKYFRQPTVDIVRWKSMASGLSGGVSMAGTLAGLLGSAVVAFIGVLLFRSDTAIFCVVTGLGFAGMLLDSVLGSVFQAKYVKNGVISEVGDRSDLVRGWHWCDNDLVNLVSVLMVALLAMFIA
jgi:uncharacterized protein (TIGR00297 family)